MHNTNILFPNGFHANLFVKVGAELFNNENQHDAFFSQNIIIRSTRSYFIGFKKKLQKDYIVDLLKNHTAIVIYIADPNAAASGFFPLHSTA